jgi:hypothetical protein
MRRMVMVLALIAGGSCGSDRASDGLNGDVPRRTPGGPNGLGEAAGVRLPIERAGSGPLAPARQSCVGATGQPVDCAAPGGRFSVSQCTTQLWGRSEVRTLDDRPSLVDHGELYPAALLQGRPFLRGELQGVGIPRGAGRLQLAAVGHRPYVREVTVMTGAQIKQTVADLAASDPVPVQPRRTVTVVEAHSADQLAFELGTDGRYRPPGLAFALGLENADRRTNTVVMAVSDIFFTVAFEPPSSNPTSVFRDGDHFTDADGSMGKDNPPLYVASASYGRQLLVAVRSAAPSSDLQAALQGALAGAAGGTMIRPGVTFESVLASADVRTLVRGGSLDATGPPYEQMRAFLAKPPAGPVATAATTAALVTYSLRYLDDGKPVSIAFSATYDQVRCAPLPDRPFAIQLTGANIDSDLYVWLEGPAGEELVYYTKERAGGTVNLSELLARQSAPDAVVHLKVGNGNCFGASADVAISVDGQERWKAVVDKALADCGWQLEAKIHVNAANGAVDELFRWTN